MNERPRSMPPPSKTPSGEHTSSASPAVMTACPHCNASNHAEYLFCVQCGGNLQEACPHCQKPVRVGNPFCGSCGKQIFDPETKQKQQWRQALKEVEKLCQDGYHNEAAELLKALNIASSRYQQKIEETVSKLYDDYRKCFREAGERFEQGLVEFEEKKYDTAYERLEKIPHGLRNKPITELWDKVCRVRDEIKSLEARLDEKAAQARPIEALTDAERLLELIPDHSTARQLSQKISSRLCRVASQRIEALKYRSAQDILLTIPSDLQTAKIRQLLAKASELCHIVHHLSTAATVTPMLLPLLRRWHQLASYDKRIGQFGAKIKQRIAQQQKNPELTMKPWAPSPDATYVGFPIQWIQGFKNIEVEGEEVPREFLECPTMFSTAVGLALQGLEKSTCQFNWYDAPRPGSDTKKLVLQKMGHWIMRNNRSARDMEAAWGIDMGSRCLKAVRLRWKPSQKKPTVTNVVYIPYDHTIDLTKDPAVEADCLIEVLKKFVEQAKTKRERIAINLSGKHLLCRTITLPPMEKSQVHGALTIEAQRRFHFPSEELAWDYQILRKTKIITAEKREVEVTALLAGVRRAYIAQRLAMCSEVKLRIDVIQSDAIALYNFLIHEAIHDTHILPKGKESKAIKEEKEKETTKEEKEEKPESRTIACLDVGCEKTNALIIGTDGVLQISSLAFGIRHFYRNFCETFDLEHQEAEHLVWHPETAPDLHRFFESTNEVLETFSDKVNRTMQPYDGTPWQEPVEKIYLTGGGIRFHGLLGYLQHGPEKRQERKKPISEKEDKGLPLMKTG